jgi:plastocyanin
MRKTSIAAGLALALAACGGEKKADNQQTTTTPDQQQAPAPAANAPAGTGKTHDVNMELDGSNYKFSPSSLVINAGDMVRYHNKSGGPHNVSFWPDSIPGGAAGVLNQNMPNQMAPLEGPLLTDPEATYEVSFAGAPKGVYKFFCLPHLALGMKGNITVQ